MVFVRPRKVIFVHGRFWHGHRRARGDRTPATNTAYWTRKIGRNKERDQRTLATLRSQGWDSLIIWECELRDPALVAAKLTCFLGPKAEPL
jgi:DNA mismatch endonuclease, patch repair protein